MSVVDEVIARVASQGLRVYEADPTSPRYPYVVVWSSNPRRTSNRAADVRVQDTLWWQTTVVGETAAQCRAAGLRVVDALSDWAPVVEGRVCHKVEHLDAQPVAKDASLPDRVVFYGTDQWRHFSSPVSA